MLTTSSGGEGVMRKGKSDPILGFLKKEKIMKKFFVLAFALFLLMGLAQATSTATPDASAGVRTYAFVVSEDLNKSGVNGTYTIQTSADYSNKINNSSQSGRKKISGVSIKIIGKISGSQSTNVNGVAKDFRVAPGSGVQISKAGYNTLTYSLNSTSPFKFQVDEIGLKSLKKI